MNLSRTILGLLGCALAVGAFQAYRCPSDAGGAGESMPSAVSVLLAERASRTRPEPAPRAAARPEVQGRTRVASAPQSEAVPAELLGVLRACMAPSQLRPAPGTLLDPLAAERLLDDCLRGSDPLQTLQGLSASLARLGAADREDAVLLTAYLAHRLLAQVDTTEARAAITTQILDGYRGIEGPHLRRITEWLLSRAYVNQPDSAGVARELAGALDRELDAGATAHGLGPLLRASLAAASSSKSRRLPGSGGELGGAVERAIPRAIELALATVSAQSEPHELRDALLLLENALLAAPVRAESVRAALPRLLDGLGELDLNRIQESGIEMRTLAGLLSQAESRVWSDGALDLEAGPLGGRTSPADLRRRWRMENEWSLGPETLDPAHRSNRPPEFR